MMVQRTVMSRISQYASEVEPLLPTQRHEIPSAMPAKEVTKVALRLKYQIEQVVPCELEIVDIEKPHSSIITDKVIQTAREAGGEKYKSCVVYCLLIVRSWFEKQSKQELWDDRLYDARVAAAETIAKRMYVVMRCTGLYIMLIILQHRERRRSRLLDGSYSAPSIRHHGERRGRLHIQRHRASRRPPLSDSCGLFRLSESHHVHLARLADTSHCTTSPLHSL